jgi:hypothetical protein
MLPRFAFVASIIGLAVPVAAAAQDAPDRPTLWDVISVEYLATAAANMLMSSARAYADIRYDQISVDPMAARIDVIGLSIEPLVPGGSGLCRTEVAQASLHGASLDRIAQGRLSLVLYDMEMTNGCLPAEIAPMARGLGIDPIISNRIEVDLNYDYATGGGTLRLAADFETLAALELHADLDYMSYRMDAATGEPVLAADLTAADLSVTDLGAWAICRNFLPDALQQPEALAAMVSQMVQGPLRDFNGLVDPVLSDAQAIFAENLGAQVAALLEGQSRIVVSTNIGEAPLRLSEASLDDFHALFDALSLDVGSSAPGLAHAIPVGVLEAALLAETLPDNALEVGRALITGTGAPLNVAEGLRLLMPLVENGDAEAAALAAAALETRDTAAAYGHGLYAAAAGAPGMLALLDRIERQSTFDAMMTAQENALAAIDGSDVGGDPRAVRSAMRGYFQGSDLPRSYAGAYYWALIGAASGDPAGTAMRHDINERMRLRGDTAQWGQVAAGLENAALRDWIGTDMPAALSAGR